MVFELYQYDLEREKEKYAWDQWLQYWNAWLLWPGSRKCPKPSLIPFGEFNKRANLQQQNRSATWEEAETAGEKAYLALRRKTHGSKTV